MDSVPSLPLCCGDHRICTRLDRMMASPAGSKLSFSLLFQRLPIGTCVVAIPGGRIVVINPAFCDLTGYNCNDAEFLSLWDLAVADRRADLALILSRLGEESTSFSTCLKAKDGRELWARLTLAPISDGTGVAYQAVAMIEDETCLREAEAEARLHQQRLLEAGKLAAMGTLISGVAHEINNPNNFIALNLGRLQSILADCLPILDQVRRDEGDFLLGGLPYDEVRKSLPGMVKDLSAGSQRIAGIVGDLLRFARPADEGQDAPVDCNQVVERACRLLAHPIREATDRFHLDLSSALPSVRGNARRLEQVVVNLVQNACQALAGRDGAVSVTTRREGDEAVIEIRDQGHGIPASDLPRLKEPFFTTKRGRGGTGLGLWICQTIVTEHGGRLEIASQVGEGTVVRVRLPGR